MKSSVLDKNPELLTVSTFRTATLDEIPEKNRSTVPSLLNDRFEVLLWLGETTTTSDFVGYDRLAHQSVVVRVFSQDLTKNPVLRRHLGGLFSKIHSLNHSMLVPIIEWGCHKSRFGFEPIHFVVTQPPDGPTLGRRLSAQLGREPAPASVTSSIHDLLGDLASQDLKPSKIDIDNIWLVSGNAIQVDPVDLALDIALRFGTSVPSKKGEGHGPLGQRASQPFEPVGQPNCPLPVPLPILETALGPQPRPITAPKTIRKTSRDTSRNTRRQTCLRAARNLTVPLVSAILLAVSWFSVAPPAWGGGQLTFTIVSGKSMEPAFHTGDLVVLLRASKYEIGDVVTYSVPEKPYTSYNVVHRIIDQLPDGRFVIRGDNRDANDPWLIGNSDIHGKQVLLVPKAGFVLVFFSSPIGFALMFGVLVTAWLWGSPMLRGED